MNVGSAGDDAERVHPVDPALFLRDDVRRILAALDIGALYRVLGDGWAPRTAFEQAGADCTTARTQLGLGWLDAAEAFAASAARNYGDAHFRFRTIAELVLAEVCVRAGEPRGLPLAHRAITAAGTLQSVAVRRERLLPLAAALKTRPGDDAQQLARTARHLAATRA